MPSLVGLNIYEGIRELENLGLQVEVEGDGDIIYSQYPMPSTLISKNSVVVVSCE